MSLKSFHIVFIALSIFLAIGFGIWEVLEYARSGESGHLLVGIASIIVAVALTAYGIRFLRKLKHMSYL